MYFLAGLLPNFCLGAIQIAAGKISHFASLRSE
jgi:hypothetical protein